jgi:transposase
MKSIVGVDVSKDTFDVFVLIEQNGKHCQFPNTKTGFKQLWSYLLKLDIGNPQACMEATGLYWEKLAEYLHEKGAVVFVVNARRVKGFAMSEDKRTKTDKVDAGVIARFCRAHFAELKPWLPPTAQVRKLQSLTRQLDSLKEDRARQLIRLKSALLCSEVSESIKNHIKFLNGSIKKMEEAIEILIQKDKPIEKQYALATSIKGVGPATASTILAECRLFKEFCDRRQVTAFAGLDVSEFVSGSSIHMKPRLSKRGNSRVRKAMYMSALCAKRHNPIIKNLYNRLLANGKTKMQAIGACMRKLLELIFAVVKSGKKFDPNYAHPAQTS